MASLQCRCQARRTSAGLAAQPRSLPHFCLAQARSASRPPQFLYDIPHSRARAPSRDDAHTEQTGMSEQKHEQYRAEEAQAMERVVAATRQVQVAFTALQTHYPPQGSGKPSKLALQTFDAALQALEDAQATFDEILNDLLDEKR
ncbi:hypothetical protein CNE_2c19270 [Cupriavidus necator N-1]|uniref:Uncharacterized protein n=3 Tax=Cupriavidus TaxID=106589 RepID=F8GRL8_CUPNN|nr:hypothetical protein CNE_2c19270 [Cupriavidus necator N-1]